VAAEAAGAIVTKGQRQRAAEQDLARSNPPMFEPACPPGLRDVGRKLSGRPRARRAVLSVGNRKTTSEGRTESRHAYSFFILPCPSARILAILDTELSGKIRT
jgi:hypothetical protein